MAVNPTIDYVVVTGTPGSENENTRFVLAESRLGHYARELGDDAAERVVRRLKGTELLGLTYTPPFPYFVGREKAHQILSADYVTTDEGTGIVHIAPAFGEEDMLVTDAAGITPVVPVDAGGKFTDEVPAYAGQHVFDANKAIIADLKNAAAHVNPGTVLLRQETYDHPYPHCWRCGNPLIYRAVSSWFVKVTDIKDRMVELNQDITWVPEHIKEALSASGWPMPGTGRSAVTATGDRRSRCGPRTTRPSRGSTSTAHWTRSSATSVSARPTCTARTSTT